MTGLRAGWTASIHTAGSSDFPLVSWWVASPPVRVSLPRLGHALIDRQHVRLAATAGALHAAAQRGRPARALLGRLIRDTRRHFASEDRLMRQVGYAEEAGHRALHDGVIAEMLRMRAMLAEGRALHTKHADLVIEWLRHHTAEADRNLVEQLLRQRHH